jgi:hypothetical protein
MAKNPCKMSQVLSVKTTAPPKAGQKPGGWRSEAERPDMLARREAASLASTFH